MEMMISRKYEVLGQLGQGGMGVVYKVRHVALDTILALKVLPRDLMANPEMVTRFYHEARVMARLRHPNIIRVLDIDRDEALDFHYFVMEYIQGKTLRQYIQEQGPSSSSEVLTIAHQVARALAYAHAHTPPIIHRDIKPANIMIEDDSSRIVVMDFGLAKELGASEMTQAGVVLGTLKYSPPEQLRHEPLDGSADVYALGMVMYETYTGAHFFAGLDEAGVIGKLLYDSSENEPHFPSPTPIAFATLVQKAIAKSRGRRYPRVTDLLHDIEACSAALGDNATVISPPPNREEAPPESSDIDDLDQQIRKLEVERQRRLATTARVQAQDAREKATAAGAKLSTADLLQQGSAKEELGHARMQSGNYAAALTVYQEAIEYFTKAREATATATQSQQSTFSSPQATAQEEEGTSDSLWTDLPDTNAPTNTFQEQAKEDRWEIGERIPTPDPGVTVPPPSAAKSRTSFFGILGLVVLLVAGWVGYSLLSSNPPPPSQPLPLSPPSPPPPPALQLSQVAPRDSSVKVTEGEAVPFAAQAVGAEPILYQWTLEGKPVSQERQWTYRPTAEESDAQEKTVRLTVTDQLGHQQEKEWKISILAANQPPRILAATPPQAALTLFSGTNFTFALDTKDPENGQLSYEWTVDGKTVGTQQSFTWKAHEAGDHRVRALVRDQAGLTASHEWQIAVAEPPPTLPPAPQNTPPHVAQRLPAESSVTTRTGEIIEFSAVALDPEGETVLYNWFVDKKRAAQGDRFQYQAGAVGKHRIELEVKDKGGLKDNVSWEVQVEALPAIPRITMYTPHKDNLKLYAHLSRFFGVEVEVPGLAEPAIQYAWKIDGRSASGQELLEFRNQKPGRHEVEVTATGPSGASIAHKWIVDVQERQATDEQGPTGPPHLEMVELDNNLSADKKQVIIKGKISNVDDRDVENVIIWISALDPQQKTVSRRLALPAPQPLSPGQVGTFQTSFSNHEDITDFRVEIVSK